MNNKETKIVPYQCQKLNEVARLVLTYHKITEDYKVISVFDCKNRSECGVEIPSENGRSWTCDWDSCPAHLELNKKK